MITLFQRHEATGVITGFTLGTLFLVQNGQLPLFPDDGVNRTGFLACAAFYALVLDNLPQQQLFAAVGWAAFIVYVRLVLITEIVNG